MKRKNVVVASFLCIALCATGCAWRYDSGGFQWTTIFGGPSKTSKRHINPVTWDAEHRDHAPCWMPLGEDPQTHTVILPPPGRRIAEGFVTAYEQPSPGAISIYTDEVSPPVDDMNADSLTLRHAVCANEDLFYGEIWFALGASDLTIGDIDHLQVLQVTGMPMCEDAHGRFIHQWACSDGFTVEVARGASHQHRLEGLTAVFKLLKEQRLLGSDKR